MDQVVYLIWRVGWFFWLESIEQSQMQNVMGSKQLEIYQFIYRLNIGSALGYGSGHIPTREGQVFSILNESGQLISK